MKTKKDQIIIAARDLFAAHGYRKVSMDEIASTAKVTKRTIYNYFKDKYTLFDYFIVSELNKMKKIVEDVESQGLPFFDTVNTALVKLIKYKMENNFLSTITKESGIIGDEVTIRSIKKVDQSIKDYIAEKIEKAKQKKVIIDCDTRLVTFLIYKIYIAIIFEIDGEKIPLDEQQVTNNIMEILKSGLFNTSNQASGP